MKHLGIDVQFELKNIKKSVFLDGEISTVTLLNPHPLQHPTFIGILTCFPIFFVIYV